jgi:hypothetical protein
MVYIYRALWALGVIPFYLITCVAFFIGLLTYPLVCGVYYIIHGTNDAMKWEIDTMANAINRKYHKLKDLIENQKKL